MGLVNVGGGRVDENEIEEKIRDPSSYEMRARSQISLFRECPL